MLFLRHKQAITQNQNQILSLLKRQQLERQGQSMPQTGSLKIRLEMILWIGKIENYLMVQAKELVGLVV
ncbi:MAG: hypothetical protein EBR82_27240 [Caulobacteraceae bacterium]|nr:hypothetical protein [Caulobacteraceae bacterium]